MIKYNLWYTASSSKFKPWPPTQRDSERKRKGKFDTWCKISVNKGKEFLSIQKLVIEYKIKGDKGPWLILFSFYFLIFIMVKVDYNSFTVIFEA